MSDENIELVRRIYDLWNRGESPRELIDPELEYENPPNAVETGTRVGRSALQAIRDVYPDFRVEPERFLLAGEEVVVIGVARATPASGVEVGWRQGYIWTIRNGRAIRFRWFNDPAEALRAAGLDEDGRPGRAPG